MKKIFILTGETSGDKLASKVISKLRKRNNNIEFLSVGGEYLQSLGVKTLYNLDEITYLGFTRVISNIFSIREKINLTAKKIIEFKPDILFSVDSPDFTLRVARKVKERNPDIKTIHFVSPKVYVWRKSRVKKLKLFLDHMLLLFPFEKKYFDAENMNSTFVGHPLLDDENENKVDISNFIKKNKKIISIYPGSRLSEIKVLMPIIIKFIKLSQSKYDNFSYILHSTKKFKNLVNNFITKSNLMHVEVISEESIKKNILKNSVFAIAKSGTISLEISKAQVPSIIIYKMNFINFFIIKLLVKVKFANIFNIISQSEIIPELLQSKCNHTKIFDIFNLYLNKPYMQKEQINKCNDILNSMKSNMNSTDMIANILNKEI